MSEMLANLIDEIRDHGFEKVFKRYYSCYRALVMDNADPEQRGRIKVQVPALFGTVTLPEFATPKDFRATGPQKGEFYPPDVDDWVFVEFEGGDSRFPLYSGGWSGEDELAPEFAHEADVPQVRGYKSKYGHAVTFDETTGKEKIIINTPGGHFLILDDTAGTPGVFLIHSTGAQMQTDAKGNIKIIGADGSFIFVNSATGAVTHTAKSGAYITVDANGISMTDASGKSFFSVASDAITANSGGGFVVNANSFGVTCGGIDMRDTLKAGLKVSNGQVALGGPTAELLDLVGQIIDAFVQAPTLVTTGTGPSSPLTPPASIQLTLIKTLLMTIKGSL